MPYLLLLSILLLLPSPLWAAIAYVGATTAEAESGSGPTLSHNFGSGANKIAIVARCIREAGGSVQPDTAVPTLGGNNMTQIGTGWSHTGGVMRLELYYYLSPPSGSQSIVSFPHATTDRNLTTVLEYTGVAQTSTFNTATSAEAVSTNVDVDSIASAVGELGILGACIRRGSAGITASADATAPVSTERVDVAHSGATSGTVAVYEEAGAVTSINMRVDISESVQWIAAGVSMRAAADAVTRRQAPVFYP